MEMEVHRDLGKHDAQIEALQTRVERLHQDMGTVLDELAKINQVLSEAKGGWKAMMIASGFASAVTALAMKFYAWLAALPPSS